MRSNERQANIHANKAAMARAKRRQAANLRLGGDHGRFDNRIPRTGRYNHKPTKLWRRALRDSVIAVVLLGLAVAGMAAG